MPARESASASAGSSVSGSSVSLAIVAGSADSATRRPSARAAPSAGSQAPPATAIPLANGGFLRPDRGSDPHGLQGARVVDAQEVSAGGDGERHRRAGGPLPLGGGQTLLPRAGQHRAEEVLARQRDV